MKLFNYLLLLLLFPLAQYAALEDDLVQLVVVLENVNPLLSTTSKSDIKKEMLKNQRKIDVAEKLDVFKEKVGDAIKVFNNDSTGVNYFNMTKVLGEFSDAIEKERSENKKDQILLDRFFEKYRSKNYTPILKNIKAHAISALIQYAKDIKIADAVADSNKIQEILDQNTKFFGLSPSLSQSLSPRKSSIILNLSLTKYKNLLNRAIQDSSFKNHIDEIKPQEILSNFLALIDAHDVFKDLRNNKNYQEAKALIEELNKNYPPEVIPATSETKEPEKKIAEEIKKIEENPAFVSGWTG